MGSSSNPLVDGAKRLEQGFESAVSRIPTPGHTPAKSNTEADPDAVKAANKTFVDKDAKDKAAAQATPDHKAAVQKMQPQHVHKLVQDAHDGKFGPDAQKTAQQAMQPQASTTAPQDPTQSQPAQPNYASMFQGGQSTDDDSDQAVPAGQMFGGK